MHIILGKIREIGRKRVSGGQGGEGLAKRCPEERTGDGGH